MTTSNQSITGTINFEAFGQTAGSTGSSSSPYMPSGPYGYAGAWGYRTEGDAGLVHVGARYYDAQVGRFITRDTVLSEHPYLYCERDAVNLVDPSGHDPGTGSIDVLYDPKHHRVEVDIYLGPDSNPISFDPGTPWQSWHPFNLPCFSVPPCRGNPIPPRVFLPPGGKPIIGQPLPWLRFGDADIQPWVFGGSDIGTGAGLDIRFHLCGCTRG